MSIFPFIKKDIEEMPDCYGIKIFLPDGKIIDLEVTRHFVDQNRMLVVCTKDDKWIWIDATGLRIEHDKRWSKIVALREEAAKKV